MSWSQRGLLVYPKDALTEPLKDAVAQAYVAVAGLETFASERLMFDKAPAYSGDFGATDTHRAIDTALTPGLADALGVVGAGGAPDHRRFGDGCPHQRAWPGVRWRWNARKAGRVSWGLEWVCWCSS